VQAALLVFFIFMSVISLLGMLNQLMHPVSPGTRTLAGVVFQNLSVLNAGRARAVRFSTSEKLCQVLKCQPGDLLAFESEQSRGEDLMPASEDAVAFD
jgi:DNA-binding Xre family transcriptional regulator